MPNKKQVFTWPLSLLIFFVSFLSVLVVLKQVQAAWVQPNYLPSDTDLVNNFVFTPLAEDLDLGSKKITKTGQSNFVINPGADLAFSIQGGANGGGTAGAFVGNVTVTGNLTVDGTISGGGGGGGGGDDKNWLINTTASNDLYYTTTTPATGNVGIGTNNPAHRLHILATAENAEIDLQSGGAAGDNSHWGIYHDQTSDDLRFWKDNADRITFADTGEVGVNAVSNTNYQLYVSTNTTNKTAVRGESSSMSGTGVYGEGAIGLQGVATGNTGVGIFGFKGSGANSMAGVFIGDLIVASGAGYLQLPVSSFSTGCDAGHVGRMTLDSVNNYLYVCSGSPVSWKRVILN